MNVGLRSNPQWPYRPAWSILRSREEFGGDGPLLSLSAVHGVRERIEGEGRAASEDTSGYRVVRSGDLVINRLVARDGAIAVATVEGNISPAYWVLMAEEGFDTRFISYVLNSTTYLAEIGARSKFMPPAQFDLLWDQFRTIPIPCPPEGAQARIADFLDAETARIDALIAKKHRLITAAVELADVSLRTAFERRQMQWPGGLDELETLANVGAYPVMHLSQCLDQLTNGFVGPTRDILVNDGIRYVQSLHIKGGAIDFGRRPFYVSPEWHAERPRIHLREDDVLIVQTGDIGQVAVVPPDFGEASCHALQIARCRRTILWGPYLAEYLRSSLGYQSLVSRATGALHPHLEGSIRSVPVIVPPLDTQKTIVAEVAEARRLALDFVDRLNRQIDLLREHRKAMITAAVTGELEISGVAA